MAIETIERRALLSFAARASARRPGALPWGRRPSRATRGGHSARARAPGGPRREKGVQEAPDLREGGPASEERLGASRSGRPLGASTQAAKTKSRGLTDRIAAREALREAPDPRKSRGRAVPVGPFRAAAHARRRSSRTPRRSGACGRRRRGSREERLYVLRAEAPAREAVLPLLRLRLRRAGRGVDERRELLRRDSENRGGGSRDRPSGPRRGPGCRASELLDENDAERRLAAARHADDEAVRREVGGVEADVVASGLSRSTGRRRVPGRGRSSSRAARDLSAAPIRGRSVFCDMSSREPTSSYRTRGAFWHVTARGNERRAIFREDADRREFLDVLAQVVTLSLATSRLSSWGITITCCSRRRSPRCRGHAPSQRNYTQGSSAARARVGHLFQGRFHSVLVERSAHLDEVARYVVLNPVRAGLSKTAAGWSWSSYRATAGLDRAPSWLETRATLESFGASRTRGLERYRAFVSEGRNATYDPWTEVTGQVYLGGTKFREEAAIRLRKMPVSREVPRAQRFPVAPPGDFRVDLERVAVSLWTDACPTPNLHPPKTTRCRVSPARTTSSYREIGASRASDRGRRRGFARAALEEGAATRPPNAETLKHIAQT